MLTPTVTIAGVDYTGTTLESVRITRGREEVFSEPRAGYCVIDLIDLDGTGFDFDVLADVQVTLTDSVNADVPVFTGIVSDWSAAIYDVGEVSGTPASILTVIATGPLALLNRRSVATGGLPEQKDGERIAALIEDALAASWEEVSGTWATVAEATTTWATFDDGIDLALIDQPGVFDVAALPADDAGYSALGAGYAAALSGRGVIFDTADGFVAYQDADRRETAAQTDGYLELDAGLFVARTFGTSSTQANLVNRVAVTFAGGEAIYSDEASILEYGVRATRFDTILANQSQALAWSLDYLEDHLAPTVTLQQATMRLDGITDTGLLDELIGIDVGSPVVLTGMPATLGFTQLPAFVEGLAWTIDRFTTALALTMSDAQLSIGSIRWGSVPASLAWDDVPATLSWEDARSL
jgi:hypothetical protein